MYLSFFMIFFRTVSLSCCPLVLKSLRMAPLFSECLGMYESLFFLRVFECLYVGKVVSVLRETAAKLGHGEPMYISHSFEAQHGFTMVGGILSYLYHFQSLMRSNSTWFLLLSWKGNEQPYRASLRDPKCSHTLVPVKYPKNYAQNYCVVVSFVFENTIHFYLC